MMKEDMQLSKKQIEVIERSKTHGRRLVRQKGGYWTFAGTPLIKKNGSVVPEWYCSTNTIFALVRRGYIDMIDWKTCYIIHTTDIG